MKITHQDIANRVGCSRAIVTQALHHSNGVRVSPETRRTILQVAEELGYVPRAVTTRTIGFVVSEPELSLDFIANSFQAASRLLQPYNYRLTLFSLNMEETESIRQLISGKTVDGVIFTQWENTPFFQEIAESIPSVLLVDDPELSTGYDQISVDTIETTARAANYLIQRGHRRICLTVGQRAVGIHERMRKGMERAFYNANLPLDSVRVLYVSEADVIKYDGEKDPLSVIIKDPPTAIITNSPSAPGGVVMLLNRLQHAGLRIPEDVSILSLVDSKQMQMLRPRITATTALGLPVVEAVVERLIKRIRHSELSAERLFIPGEILERDSVRTIQ